MDPYCLISAAISAYTIILFIRIILSWTTMFGWSPPPSLSPIIRVIIDLTEPLMALFRRFIPPLGGFDLSPIFIFLILGAIGRAFPC